MYACLLWPLHCEKAQASESLQPLLERFLMLNAGRSPSLSFTKWNNLLWRIYHSEYTIDSQLRHRLEDAISVPANLLLAACIWGFHDVALQCISQDPSLIDRTNHRGKSPLFLSCENGHTDMVTSLVRRKAPVNDFHPIWGTCLQKASLGRNPWSIYHGMERRLLSDGGGGSERPTAVDVFKSLVTLVGPARSVWVLKASRILHLAVDLI